MSKSVLQSSGVASGVSLSSAMLNSQHGALFSETYTGTVKIIYKNKAKAGELRFLDDINSLRRRKQKNKHRAIEFCHNRSISQEKKIQRK